MQYHNYHRINRVAIYILINLNSSIISDINSKFKIHLCSLLNSIFKEEHIAKLPFSDKFCSTIGGKPNIESRQHFQGG